MRDPDRLCLGCMEELTHPGERCKKCGFDQKEYEKNRDVRTLPSYTILAGKYLLGRVLGEGGFGITYLAWDLNRECKIAIKEYFPAGLASRDTSIDGRETITVIPGEKAEYYRTGLHNFAEEGKNLLRFQNLPGIVSVRDFFQDNHTAYLVMEYAEGVNLKQYLRLHYEQNGNGTPMSEAEVLSMMQPVLKALGEIHKEGIVHRDISPENIIRGTDGKMTLIDFGAARVATGNETKSLTIMLKHGYAPPEQYQSHGKQGPWTDIYAICATMYHMLAGKLPVESIDRVFEDTLLPLRKVNPEVTRNVSDVIEKGMSILGKDRYQSVEEMQKILYPKREKRPEPTAVQKPVEEAKEEKREEPVRAGKKRRFSKEDRIVVIVIVVFLLIAWMARWLIINHSKNISLKNYTEASENNSGENISLKNYAEVPEDNPYVYTRAEAEDIVSKLSGERISEKELEELENNALDTEEIQIPNFEELSLLSEEQKDKLEQLKEFVPFISEGMNGDAADKYGYISKDGDVFTYELDQDNMLIFNGFYDLRYEGEYGSAGAVSELKGNIIDQKYNMLQISGHLNIFSVFTPIYSALEERVQVAAYERIEHVGENDYWIRDFAENGLAGIGVNGKCGYINAEGEVIIPLEYDAVGRFSEGLAPIKIRNKYGYINELNEMIIPPIFASAGDFSNGYAAVEFYGEEVDRGRRKLGYIDTEGNLRILFKKLPGLPQDVSYDTIDSLGKFNESGTAIVGASCLNEEGDAEDSVSYIILDENGTIVREISSRYLMTDYQPNGLALCMDLAECKEKREEYQNKEEDKKWEWLKQVEVTGYYLDEEGERTGPEFACTVGEYEVFTSAFNYYYCLW